MDNKTQIARELASSRVGLQRGELVARLKDIPAGSIDSTLSYMQTNGHVEKRISGQYYRYSLTTQGRAAYSTLNDDEPLIIDTDAPVTDQDPIKDDDDPVIVDLDQETTFAEQPAMRQQTAILAFDIDDTLDRALYGLVKVIKDAATVPAIQRKAEKLALLETMENDVCFSGKVRALLSYIREDIAALDDAA
jgi:DNA-binding HxlR family transcriptional regulator